MTNQPTTFMIINQADVNYCLSARGSKVALALADPRDPYQMYLVKYYQADDNSVLWTESRNEDKGFKNIRWAGKIEYSIVVSSHEIHDGRVVDLATGNHISQRWKFVASDSKDVQQVTAPQMVTISCRSKEGFNLTVRNETAMLAPANLNDIYQIWIKDVSYSNGVKDLDGKQAFALVNKATGKAIKHGFGPRYRVCRTPLIISSAILQDYNKYNNWGKTGQDRYMAFISWKKICKPLEEGGLGVKHLESFGQALFLKIVWSVMAEEDKLWVTKYCPTVGLEGEQLWRM
ncbi:hypothetical protein LUZ61_020859 [Rhynchospora tenuis]|uniref:Uncharacterized protein n=1 Tax=Rhynchospora tenuis TaxID=198213 RepID=A0AAD6EP71_9POAL|nr:hypothetical protein LUZ61_020859 [Rhynchospora tenuis]